MFRVQWGDFGWILVIAASWVLYWLYPILGMAALSIATLGPIFMVMHQTERLEELTKNDIHN